KASRRPIRTGTLSPRGREKSKPVQWYNLRPRFRMGGNHDADCSSHRKLPLRDARSAARRQPAHARLLRLELSTALPVRRKKTESLAIGADAGAARRRAR